MILCVKRLGVHPCFGHISVGNTLTDDTHWAACMPVCFVLSSFAVSLPCERLRALGFYLRLKWALSGKDF